MLLLTLISLGQLVVSLLILGALAELARTQASAEARAARSIAALQQQTVDALLGAEAAARDGNTGRAA